MKQVLITVFLSITMIGICPAQSVQSVSPNIAMQGETLPVTITGANTRFDLASSLIVRFTTASSTLMVTPSTISALQIKGTLNIPLSADIGFWTVRVLSDFETIAPLNSGFRVIADTIVELTSIDPNQGTRGDILIVQITGRNTHFSPGSTTLTFRQGNTLNTTYPVVFNTKYLEGVFNIPADAPVGLWDVLVHVDGYPDVIESGGFHVFSPCGDINADTKWNMGDAVFLINHIFAGGIAPLDFEHGDVDCSGNLNLSDVVYFVNYIFGGGPAPCLNCR